MERKLIHVLPEHYVVSQWSGGKTVQLGIAPEGAVYADRDFLWRLSSATVELEESDFTPLPDYMRLISVLQGEMRLSHDGAPMIRLQPYVVHSFDGGIPTHSEGRCVDFNLMLRKGRCRGSLQALRAEQAGAVSLSPAVLSMQHDTDCTFAVYCGQGSVRVSACGQSAVLKAGETALLESIGVHAAGLDWAADTSLMLAQIWF